MRVGPDDCDAAVRVYFLNSACGGIGGHPATGDYVLVVRHGQRLGRLYRTSVGLSLKRVGQEADPTLSEAVLQGELEHAGATEDAGDLAERGGRHRLIADLERGVIEDISNIHAEIDRVALGDLRALQETEIERCVPWAVEDAATKRTDGSGSGHVERLSGEGRRAVRSHCAPIAADDGSRRHVGSVAGHAEGQDIA